MSKPPEHKVDGKKKVMEEHKQKQHSFFGHVKCEVLTEGTGGNIQIMGGNAYLKLNMQVACLGES